MLRLERQFRIHGVALEWFHSYLQGRSFRVTYGHSMSTMIHIVCSVPQGSVLGPGVFILYKAGLVEVVQKHSVNIHVFADDTQLYRHCLRDEMSATVMQLERCLAEVSHWMSANRLKLNADKTELLWAGSKYNQSSLGSRGLSLQIDSGIVTASDHVRMLGVTFSSDLSLTNMFPAFVQHVSTGFANFDEFDARWTTSPRRHLFTSLSQPGWTTATWFSLVHQDLLLTDCKG